MRIAVISDIHGNLPALRTVLESVSEQVVDQIICLGDIAYKGPLPDECVAMLRGRGIASVCGNTDRRLLDVVNGSCSCDEAEIPYLKWHFDRLSADSIEYLKELPFEYRIQTDGKSLLFVHASPQGCNDAIKPTYPIKTLEERLMGSDADWVVMGHIHSPFQFRHSGKLLVNAGAVGFSLDGDWRPVFVVLDTRVEVVSFHRVEYDVDEVLDSARSRTFCFCPDWYKDALGKGWWEPIPWAERHEVDGFGVEW